MKLKLTGLDTSTPCLHLNPKAAAVLGILLDEHDDHCVHLQVLERITNDLTAPDDAYPTWQALYVGTHKLSDDLMDHIHTESHALFPRFTV